MSGYYELRDDRRHPGRWHLGGPLDPLGQELDPWQFRRGTPLVFEQALRLPLDVPGQPLDFCWTAFAIPIVHARVVQLFERMKVREVQFLPIQVESHPESYFILNALRIVRCIDDARCEEVRYWMPEDGQPEKVGEYRVVAGLRVDPARVGDSRIFRPWGWRVALVVSEDLKQAMEREGVTGTRFIEV